MVASCSGSRFAVRMMLAVFLQGFEASTKECHGPDTVCTIKSRKGAAMLQREATSVMGHLGFTSDADAEAVVAESAEMGRLVQLSSKLDNLAEMARKRMPNSTRALELVQVMRESFSSTNALKLRNKTQLSKFAQWLLEFEAEVSTNVGNVNAKEISTTLVERQGHSQNDADSDDSFDGTMQDVLNKIDALSSSLKKLESDGAVADFFSDSIVADVPEGGEPNASEERESNVISDEPLDIQPSINESEQEPKESQLRQDNITKSTLPDNSEKMKALRSDAETLYAEPHKWGELFPLCGKGNQSPIDIQIQNVSQSASPVKLLTYLHLVAQGDRELNNNGVGVGVKGTFGKLALPDGEYINQGFHFHFPSEHTLDGKRFPGEMHMVYTKVSIDGRRSFAVVALLLQLFAGDDHVQWFQKLKFGDNMPGKNQSAPVGTVNLAALTSLFKGGFFHYVGSTTTPPCFEGVHWYVAEKRGYIGKRQAAAAQKLFPVAGNNRPTQPLDGRTVYGSQLAAPGEFSFL
eukprot:TRINITY_DN14758_c0_g1_i1.p1 TRINITY_DN14758_c0_g1~~TRINITY_DN14758_c0_g1_i1.p1  ORF type:complete len:520 (-),score=94.07 TRINITY_DN14758_c0_g1_i1:36-1595(-)